MTDERRSQLESRVEADGPKLRGYAIVFHSESVDLGGFKEIIDPGAVDRTLTEALDVRALVDHDTGRVIGRTRAGTLALHKDQHGLRVTIAPDPEISYAKDILRGVQRGDISGMSFGFRVLEDSWNYDTKPIMRTVLDMVISEVSVVPFPAYPSTNVEAALRSLRDDQALRRGRSIAWLRRTLRGAIVR